MTYFTRPMTVDRKPIQLYMKLPRQLQTIRRERTKVLVPVLRLVVEVCADRRFSSFINAKRAVISVRVGINDQAFVARLPNTVFCKTAHHRFSFKLKSSAISVEFHGVLSFVDHKHLVFESACPHYNRACSSCIH